MVLVYFHIITHQVKLKIHNGMTDRSSTSYTKLLSWRRITLYKDDVVPTPQSTEHPVLG